MLSLIRIFIGRCRQRNGMIWGLTMIAIFWEKLKKNRTTQIQAGALAVFLAALILLAVSLSTEVTVVKRSLKKEVVAASLDSQIEEAADYYKKGNFDKAIDGLRKAVSQEPKNAEIHFMLGNAYQGTGDWKQAASSYERAAGLDASLIRAKYQLGLTYKKLGKNELASKCLKECISQAPDLGGARLALAKIYTDENRFDEAIEQYETLLEINLHGMNLASIHNELGLLFVKKGKLDEARGEWQKVLLIEPENSRAKELLAQYQ
jgi:tetratricopeptide (TPR) repeat protein